MIPSFFYRDPGSFDWPEPDHGAHCGCPRCFVEHERRHSYDSRRTEKSRREWAKQNREPRRQMDRERYVSSSMNNLLASVRDNREADRARLERMGPDLAIVCDCEDCVDYYLRTYPEFRETEGYERWLRIRMDQDDVLIRCGRIMVGD